MIHPPAFRVDFNFLELPLSSQKVHFTREVIDKLEQRLCSDVCISQEAPWKNGLCSRANQR